MLVDSSPTDNSNDGVCFCPLDIPSTIIWKQTMECITLQVNINRVQIRLSERYLKLSNGPETMIITLPLYDSIYFGRCDVQQMADMNKPCASFPVNAIELTLAKEIPAMWPHLLKQQTDKETESHLREVGLLVSICHEQKNSYSLSNNYDTLDFETVINGQGEKTGLE